MNVSIKELLRAEVIAITHEVGKAEYSVNGDDFLVMAGDPLDEFIVADIVWVEEFDHYVGFAWGSEDNAVIGKGETINVQVYRKVNADFFCG